MKENIYKLIIIIACVFGLVGLFLPYEKSNSEYREYLKNHENDIYLKEVNLKNKDVEDISIVENFKVYSYTMNNVNDEWLKGEAIINVIITIALVVFIALTILFALLKKPILTMIFSALIAGSSLLMNYDIVSRGVLPSSKYTFGISYYLYVVLFVIILACSIIILVKRKKLSK